MSPTPLLAVLVAALSASMLIVPPAMAAIAIVALVTAGTVDAVMVRSQPKLDLQVPELLSRGVAETMVASAHTPNAARVTLRQARTADLDVVPDTADNELRARLVAQRRGRHSLPPIGMRATGPLGLGCWYTRAEAPREILVYPDIVAARRIAAAVREGRFRETGLAARGMLGLGTEFESIREYLPDDDIRQVNWRATARIGRPMSNQYRIEQDRDLICVVDTGRLMTAPLGDRTRLDAALDALVAVTIVADQVRDRCGVIAFDAQIRRIVTPKRAGASAVIHAVFDLEPTEQDSDYELAFRSVGRAKRAFVLVLTDLLDKSAARALIQAVPVLARHHHVVVASATDPDIHSILHGQPNSPHDVYAAAVALDVLAERARVAQAIVHSGGRVLEAAPTRLAAACVNAYLTAKARARL